MRQIKIQTFGRRGGRKLKAEKSDLLATLLPELEIKLDNINSILNSQFSTLQLEIGFGNGEHLVHRAANNPNTYFIGCEVYIHGIGACLKEIDRQHLTNIGLFTEDARELLDALPDACLNTIYVLFPDPRPKTRHHKRRLINQDTLQTFHRVLKPAGSLHLATDHPGYAQWMLVHLHHFRKFQWQAQRMQDWQTPPEGHTTTRYESKLKAGHDPVYLQFLKT